MANTAADEGELKATFVFKGTIRKLKAATMQSAPIDERTAVVHVDEVLEAPRSLVMYQGKDITVRLPPNTRSVVGQQLVFHTAGWIFGDGIAVRVVRQDAVTEAFSASLATGGDPVQRKLSRELGERVAEADLVVSGKVVAINLTAAATQEALAVRGSVPVSRKPVSEHDPKWRQAVIAVDRVHKGEGVGEQVTVRFPASMDVAWFKAPKFEAGQQGYFVLQKGPQQGPQTEPKEGMSAQATATEREEDKDVYTALHPLDFQPYSQQDRVRAAIGGSASSTDGNKEK